MGFLLLNGQLASVNGSLASIPSGGGAPPAERSLLQASDLTFAGQQNLDQNYNNMALSIRYVGGKRRFLVYMFGGGPGNDYILDLIEYEQNSAGLKNGGSHWTISNVPNLVEIRRWRNWHTIDRTNSNPSYPDIHHSGGGNGAWPSCFHWDEAKGGLWYSFQPKYPGGGTTWPALNFTYLADSEAIVVGDSGTNGNTVSDANIKGPYYFKNSADPIAWKTACSNIMPIPSDWHGATGKKFLQAGHHAANIGADGPRSLDFWAHGDLPTPPSTGSTILTDAVHIYETGTNSGAAGGWNVRMPNIQYQVAGHASNQTWWMENGADNVQSEINNGAQAIPLATNSLLYQHDYGYIDCITVFMNNTNAAGGAWVPEIYTTAGGWHQPTGWAMHVGNQQLSALENVFYWPKTPMNDLQPVTGKDYGTWVRLRQTGTGTNGGSLEAIIITASLDNSYDYTDRPGDPSGSYSFDIESAQYDATHYSTMYEEMLWGGKWVRTDNVEGIAYFGPLKCGAQWYGGAPMYCQPIGGGTPVRHVYYKNRNFSNGGKPEGPMYPFFFNIDHNKIIEMIAGTRARNADGLQPESYVDMVTQWPGIIWYQGVLNTESPYYPNVAFYTYGNGCSVDYDPIAQQLVVWLSHSDQYSGYAIFAFFDVR